MLIIVSLYLVLVWLAFSKFKLALQDLLIPKPRYTAPLPRTAPWAIQGSTHP